MKKKTKAPVARWYQSGLVWALILLFVLGSIAFNPIPKMYQERLSRHAAQNLGRLYKGYVNVSTIPETWWLEVPPPANKESFDLYFAKKQQIMTVLQRYSAATSETKRIYDWLKDIRIGVIKDGQMLDPMLPGEKPGMAKLDPAIRFFFFTRSDADKLQQADTPTWRMDFNAVLCPARNFNEVIFAGTLFHELGHAVRHNRQNPVPVPALHSSERWLEEMDMHRVTSSVIDSARPGYYALIKRLVEKYPASSIQGLLSELKSADIEVIDVHLGLGLNASDRDILFTAILVDLATEWCVAHSREDRERAAFYGWLQQNYF